MPAEFTNSELEAYLDEALPSDQMAAIEEALRHDETLHAKLVAANGRRDAGVHSVGEIWRRHRLSCPSREQLGGYLLGVLPDAVVDYVAFHVNTIECRYCAASLDDLRARQSANDGEQTNQRRARYFQSSAGLLRRHD
jgi:hypothetical protein